MPQTDEAVRFTVPGTIRAKGRPRFARLAGGGVRTFTPDRTARAENMVALCYRQATARPPSDGPVSLNVAAHFAMPASWSGRKRAAMEGAPVLKRPDWDNVGKLVSDALNHVAYRDDGQVHAVTVRKRWARDERLEIEVVFGLPA